MADNFKQTTIRNLLLEQVNLHLTQGKINCQLTQQVGCELVGLLASYREEDRQLFPEVYLIVSNDMDLLPALAPGAPQHGIGTVNIESGDIEALARKVARTALKSCASLAIEGWRIYISRDANSFRFGLFSPSSESYSIGAEANFSNSALPCAVFRNSAESTVEIVNSVGTRLEISLTSASPSTRPNSEQIIEFVKSATSDVAFEDREQAIGYLTRVLTDFLRSSHGAIIAVAPFNLDLPNEKFSDGIFFKEPIQLINLMINAVNEKSSGAIALLRSHESFLKGMILSDGITILGTDGSIKAFRVFVHGSTTGPQPTGGARTRAFTVLRSYLNNPLKAVLVRSQDGRTEVVK